MSRRRIREYDWDKGFKLRSMCRVAAGYWQAATPTKGLYIPEVVEVIKYFRHFSYRDRVSLKAAVLLALVVDTLDTAAAAGVIYLATRHTSMPAHWWLSAASLSWIGLTHAPVPLFLILTAVAAIIGRAYLSFRFWRTQMAGTAVLAVKMVTNPSFNDRSKLRVPAIFWMAASVTSDMAIAIGLLVVSRQGILPFHGPSSYFFIQLPPIVLCDAAAGVMGAVLSSATLIVFLSDKQQTNLSFAPIISLGHLHLRNLNSRDPKPAEVRQSLPHTIQLASYLFMPDMPGTIGASQFRPASVFSPIVSQEMSKKGGRPFISAPLVVEDLRPDDLVGGSMLLQPERWAPYSSDNLAASRVVEA
ncbi:hypothetical protein B0H13DRAFT_1904010 [Mycena leptocephala]|nr:hypothetical protein B0H13DRAFT_1904010 [Mycena leptocephala]